MGADFIRDIQPGEIVTISKDGVRSDRRLVQEKHAHCIFEYIYFARPDSILDGINIYDARIRAGKALAASYPVDADLVTGVPDSGITAAMGYAQASGLPFAFAFYKNSYVGNILMKNLMDFCIGTVMFILIGFSFLLGEDLLGLIGKPGFDIFTAYEGFDWPILYLILCSAQLPQPSYPGLWPKEQNFFLTTTVSPAVATVVCMIFTWLKYGKPDVSMCLNASLAGLVAITAACDVTDCFGAIIIGAVAGLLVIFGVWLLDYKLHIDDPVGAVAVHCLNGIWGTIAVGLFATDTAPAFARGFGDGVSFGANQIAGTGLFYGGGFKLLGIQLLGLLSVAAWTLVTITLTFLVIKALLGLRVSEEEELQGLDPVEHGLASAYSGFSILDVSNTMTMDINQNTSLGTSDYEMASEAQKNAAISVVKQTAAADADIHKVVIITRLSRYDKIKNALNELGVTGMTVTQVMGCGIQKGSGEMYRGVEVDATLLPKVKIEVVVSKISVDSVVDTAKKTLYTGHIGDGKIFVYSVDRVVKVRTGEEDFAALQDVE